MKKSHPVAKRERPDIYADKLAALSPEERAQLRAMLTSPLYLKLLSMVAVFKPSPNCANAGSGVRDAFSDARTNARLGEIRGWDMHEAAIYLALNEPPTVKVAIQESFPDEGRADAAWNGSSTHAAPESGSTTTGKRR